MVGIESVIGVGAGKFLGVRRIFVRISPNLSKQFLCAFSPQIFSHKDHEDFFLVWPPKKVLMCFSATDGCHFLSQTTLSAIFAQIFSDFDQIFRDFVRIFRVFTQILLRFLTNEIFRGCACAPEPRDRFVATCVRFLAVWKSNKRANREPTSCKHSGAFYLTCFEIFTSVVSRGGARHFHLGGHWKGQFCNKGSCQWSV